jgi:hypothetical protein
MKILQIGCNNGKDHVLQYIKNHDNITEVILIDASSEAIARCKETYSDIPNSTFLHSAVVTDDSGFVDLFIPTNDDGSEHSSLNFDHLVKHHHKNISNIKVPAININILLEIHKSIDRLYIDTEGLDAQLVSSINFSKYKIPYIFFEFVHSDGAFNIGTNFERAINVLTNNGYKLNKIDTNIEASL